MQRITDKQLNSLISYLNNLTNSPVKPYEKTDTGTVAQKGNYHLDYAYGGVALYRMARSGGANDIFERGHIPKRALYDLIQAYIKGIELEQAHV